MMTTGDAFFGGRYRLMHRIARGGMGEVWRASDELLQRPVAIKLLREDLVGDPGFIGRFRAEARNTAVLSHPGIAQLHDYGEQAGRAYIVMELVAGDPLSWILAREGSLSPERALRYIGQAALALQVAHDAGVIHRDVKPANLIVTPSEQVKITDFGIAKAVGDGTLTATGQVMGTAEYLSPEQAIGGAATPLSDLYALGIVLYECLAGRRPFVNGNPVKIALAQVHEPPPSLPDEVPGPIRGLVSRLLSKEPSKRPQGGGVLAREIAHLLSDEGALGSIGPSQGAVQLSGFRHNGTFSQTPSPGSDSTTYGMEARPAGPNSTAAHARPNDQVARAVESARPTAEPGQTTRYPSPALRDGQITVRSTANTVSAEPAARPGGAERSRNDPRTSRLHDITARPTGRRRAPRRKAIDLGRMTALLASRNRRLIAIGIAAAILAALIGFVMGRDNADVPQGITIPLVRGETVSEAREALAEVGLEVLVIYTVSDNAEPDVVIDQDPQPDVRVDAGTVVRLTVSSQGAHALSRTTEHATDAITLALWNAADPAETDAGRTLSRIPGTVAGVVYVPHRATTASPVVSLDGDSDSRTGKGND